MTGPDLDRDLETIGRRLSPRLGHAHEVVVSRATAAGGARPRRPRRPLLRLRRLGGPALTTAVAAGFAVVLAVGVAHPNGSPAPSGSPAASGPAVALATSPGTPVSTAGAVPTPGPVVSGTATSPITPVAPGPQATTIVPTDPDTGSGQASTPGTAAPTRPQAVAPAPERTAPARTIPDGPPAPGAAAEPNPAPEPGYGPQATPTPHLATTQATPVAAGPARIVLTERDSGRTITVHRGDVVEVDLSNPGNGSSWSEPQSTDTSVLKRTSASTGRDGAASAVFTASGSGTARIQAYELPACASTRPQCPFAQKIGFQATVDVSGSRP